MNKVGIVITMCNQVDYTKQCVQSIVSSTPYHLILVDDFSMDGTKAWLKSLQPEQLSNCVGVTTLIDPDTVSLGQKWNLGVSAAKEAGCDAVFVCNNDILFHSKTIDNIIERFDRAKIESEPIAIVSASNKRGETTPENIFDFQITGVPTESPHPDFSCFLLDIALWEKVGKFSEIYIPCYFEDNDFHTTLKIHDLVAIAISNAPYYHYGSITQNQVEGGLCKSVQFEQNRAKFKAKFGALPEHVDIKGLKKRLLEHQT